LPQASIQRIEQFLYGSDAQWRVNRYHEDSLTPLQRLGVIDKPHMPPARIGHWAGCEVVDETGRSASNQVGLVDSLPENGEVRLLVYQVLNAGRRCCLQVHSRAGLRTLLVISGKYETILTGLGSLYLYRMTLLSMSAAPDLAFVAVDAAETSTAMAA
jgi:hypothetical protein